MTKDKGMRLYSDDVYHPGTKLITNTGFKSYSDPGWPWAYAEFEYYPTHDRYYRIDREDLLTYDMDPQDFHFPR